VSFSLLNYTTKQSYKNMETMSEERKKWQRLLSWTIPSVVAMELQHSQGSRVNRGCQLPSSGPLTSCQSCGSPGFSWPMIEHCEDNTNSTHSYPVQCSSNGKFPTGLNAVFSELYWSLKLSPSNPSSFLLYFTGIRPRLSPGALSTFSWSLSF